MREMESSWQSLAVSALPHRIYQRACKAALLERYSPTLAGRKGALMGHECQGQRGAPHPYTTGRRQRSPMTVVRGTTLYCDREARPPAVGGSAASTAPVAFPDALEQ